MNIEIRRLNSLRGFAALIVSVSHFSNELGFLSSFFGTATGQFGVMIFFLLSSFLMAVKYIDSPATSLSIRNYVVARLARIMPLYLIIIFFSYFYIKLFPDSVAFLYKINDLQTLIEHILFLKGVGVLWTIISEMHFYFLFVVAWVVFYKLNAVFPRFMEMKFIILCGVIIFVVANAGIILINTGGVKFNIFDIQVMLNAKVFPYFLMGTLLGFIYNRYNVPISLRKNWIAVLSIAAASIYPMIVIFKNGQTHLMWADINIFIAVSALFFIVIFIIPQGNKIFENNVGDFFGKISYSIYLTHFPLLLVLKNYSANAGILELIIYMISCTFLAYFIYLLFEQPVRLSIRISFIRISDTLK